MVFMHFKARLLSWSAAALITAVFLISSASAQKPPQRVYFARGATEARATGYLRGIRDEAVFVLRAKAGQHMRVDIRGRGATRGMVIFPDGQQDGAPGGVIFDGILPITGDYRIRVTESSMANAWSGSITVIINAVSEGSDAPRGTVSDLARYAGKYPSELFRREAGLKTRLRKLLGADYKMFFDRLQTEMPIENDAGVLIVRGCMAHQCTIEESILALDLGADKILVAIKSNDFRGRFKTWSEGGASIPAALRRAMQNE
jgi:hypothetical protein